MAMNWCWDTPKNSYSFAQRWQQCERLSRGEPVWYWVRKIRGLKAIKILWPIHLDEPDSEIFVVSVDGTDFRTREISNEEFNQVKGNCSHKFRHCALRYEIAISVRTGFVVWINGPFRGAACEKTIYTRGLAKKIKEGKLCISDGGYAGCDKVSMPNYREPKELRRFKTLIRTRHESFNGRVTGFRCLQETFQYAPTQHVICFEAVVVMLQYQIELGHPLYDLYLQEG